MTGPSIPRPITLLIGEPGSPKTAKPDPTGMAKAARDGSAVAGRASAIARERRAAAVSMRSASSTLANMGHDYHGAGGGGRAARGRPFWGRFSEAMAHFEGFADGKARFFKALARNNERSWFLAHKEEFEAGWNAPMKLLLADVRAAIDRAYPRCDLGEPSVFRIFRDVRFSKDKSPYKTHLGGFIPLQRAGKKATERPMALYFHVGADETLAAAGHYMMEPASLQRFREAVADDTRGRELARIVTRVEKKGFVPGAHESLKRVPKGYDPAHPRAEMLRRKGLIVRFPPPPPELLTSPRLTRWLVDHSKVAAPLVEWLLFATA